MGIQLNREYLPTRPQNGLSNSPYEQSNYNHQEEKKEKFKKNQDYYNPHKSNDQEDIIRIDYGSDERQKSKQRQQNPNNHQERKDRIAKLKKEILSGGQDINPRKGFSEDFVFTTRKLAVNKDPNRRSQSMLNSRKHSNVLLVA